MSPSLSITCSRRIVGWRAERKMKTELVLDAIEMAIWSRDHENLPTTEGLIPHPTPAASTRASPLRVG